MRSILPIKADSHPYADLGILRCERNTSTGWSLRSMARLLVLLVPIQRVKITVSRYLRMCAAPARPGGVNQATAR